MRTPDDLNPERFKPLGKAEPRPVVKDVPKPPEPRGPYGIVTDSEGRMRTTRDCLPKIVAEMLPEGSMDAWGFLP